MRGLQLMRSRSAHRSSRLYRYLVSSLTALTVLAVPAAASAANGFTEQVASARWLIPFQCPDGSMAADGRMIVETLNFIEAGTTPNPSPPLRVALVGQCPDGTFSWGVVRAAPTQFDQDLKNVIAVGTFADVRDNRGALHTVTVDARWTGIGPIVTTVNVPGSKRKQRLATATATITFDGNLLVDGPSNFPFPEPFIRIDIEK
ncbi:MAG TPA: hypothetical protein VF062_09685 [Candidatus Limnocylindrales bacterium]